ncbi:hypothetical protein [Saccharopolyspora pogona]|uniref:hypothetical protein n=1 Tax=Saccharopolyspora pogona TaxID=333966 RepID=UPI001684BA64|nr:hypothetical protein [Saccharopolyspora pogona]
MFAVGAADLGRHFRGDFIGKRFFSRADTAREDRKHLVGLLPEDPDLVLGEGAQLVEAPELPERGRVLGTHVQTWEH